MQFNNSLIKPIAVRPEPVYPDVTWVVKSIEPRATLGGQPTSAFKNVDVTPRPMEDCIPADLMQAMAQSVGDFTNANVTQAVDQSIEDSMPNLESLSSLDNINIEIAKCDLLSEGFHGLVSVLF